jgi:hypothetical protein
VLPGAEFRVEDDFVVGTVPLESVEESVVRKLAFDRLRKSLKNGIADCQSVVSTYEDFIECGVGDCPFVRSTTRAQGCWWIERQKLTANACAIEDSEVMMF